MRLFVAACCLIAGEALLFALPVCAGAWPFAAPAVLIAAAAAYGWRMPVPGWCWCFVCGMLLAARTETKRRHVLAADLSARRTVEVEVEAPPRNVKTKRGGKIAFPAHLGPQPISVSLPASFAVKPGERWRCTGTLTRPRGDRPRWQTRKFAVFDATRLQASDADGPCARWASRSDVLARRLTFGLNALPEQAAICRAMTLGREEETVRGKRSRFAAAGTVHVFAISGLHVMFVAHALVRVLAETGCPRCRRGLVALPFVAAYVALTGARASAMRAAIMAGVWLVAPALGRKPDALAAWSTAAFMVYGISPQNCFDLGCTFSFVVMLAIVFWMRWMADPVEKGLKRTLTGCGVTFAAWAAGVPLTAWAFARFTLGGLVANFVVVKVASRLVACAATGMALAEIFPPAALAANVLAACCAEAINRTSALVAALPGGSLTIAGWGPVRCCGWYAALLFGGWIGLRVKKFRAENAHGPPW